MKCKNLEEIAKDTIGAKLDPLAHVSEHLKRIEAVNPAIKALRFVAKEIALKRATEIAAQPKGKLCGAVFSAKDNLNVIGMPGSDGGELGAGGAATTNSLIVQKLLDQGAICIGKGNMPEYGKSASFTDNTIFGRTLNPFDHNRSPGGSTGGDAAAVAAGFADFCIGGDSGGSLRIPANFCGLYAIFPTVGTISEPGGQYIRSSVTRMFGSAGCITRSAKDLALVYEILAGYNPTDPDSIPRPSSPISLSKKFLFFSELSGVKCDSAIRNELNRTVGALSALGYQGREECPTPFTQTFEPFVILAGQASLAEEDLIAKSRGTPRDPSKESVALKLLRERIATLLPPLTPESLLHYQSEVARLRKEILPLFNEVGFIVTPVTATLPLHFDQPPKADGIEVDPHRAHQFARIANVLGLPAVAFPTGFFEGLPVGLQVIGPRFSEFALIDLVREITEHLDPR